MNENNTPIAIQNANRLAHLSSIFCLINNLEATEELAHVLSMAVVAAIGRWYADNGQPDFNPQTDEICDEAIKFAFARMQNIANLAAISVQTGIGMEGFNA